MDKQRMGYARWKRTRGIVAGSAASVAFLALAWTVSCIEPAARGTDAAVVFADPEVGSDLSYHALRVVSNELGAHSGIARTDRR